MKNCMRRGRHLVSLFPLNCFRFLFSYFLVDFISYTCDYEADDDPSWRFICDRKYNYCILFCVKLRPIFQDQGFAIFLNLVFLLLFNQSHSFSVKGIIRFCFGSEILVVIAIPQVLLTSGSRILSQKLFVVNTGFISSYFFYLIFLFFFKKIYL